MRLDRDYLQEMELLTHFELSDKRRDAIRPAPAPVSPSQQVPPMPSSDIPSNDAPPWEDVPVPTDEMLAPEPSRQMPARPAPAPPLRQQVSFAKSPAAPASAPAQDAATLAAIGAADWDQLKSLVEACRACGLCQKRTQTVFGVGAPSGPWLFVGEGPGAEEDATGEPFVGQAGKLLDAMLTAADLQRGRDVYIANVVKCRPPGNRTPQPVEAAACAAFLDRQIALIQPKIIVALGKTAILRLTGSDAAMAAHRQRVLKYQGIPMVATYHPAYLLRNLPDKIKAWEDLMFAKATLADL